MYSLGGHTNKNTDININVRCLACISSLDLEWTREVSACMVEWSGRDDAAGRKLSHDLSCCPGVVLLALNAGSRYLFGELLGSDNVKLQEENTQ